MNWILLLVAVLLSSGRSIFSKQIKYDGENKAGFYFSQAMLFFSAGVIVLICNPKAIMNISSMTVLLAIIYGALLVISQWCYTISLQKGPTSICTMLYSFGFIFPTLSGTLFWNEPFTVSSLIGLVLTILAIVMSALSIDGSASGDNKRYIVPVLFAMTASGGLGIMQKIHQTSKVADQRDAFLVIAFAIAMVVSGLAMLIFKKNSSTVKTKIEVFPVLAGICFGIANLLNTLLAGRIDSAILFPIQNIGVMLICAVLGVVIFRERITKSQSVALGLGALAILVLSR